MSVANRQGQAQPNQQQPQQQPQQAQQAQQTQAQPQAPQQVQQQPPQQAQQAPAGVPVAIIPVDALARLYEYLNAGRLNEAKEEVQTLMESLLYGGVTVLAAQPQQAKRQVKQPA